VAHGDRAGLGLKGYDGYQFVVEDIERSARFYTERFGFDLLARSSAPLVGASGQESRVYGTGQIRAEVTTPLTSASRAARYLRHHPAGVAMLSFRVANLETARRFLEDRRATFLDRPVEHDCGCGTYRSFDIATPLGDVVFRFVERGDGYCDYAPGFDTIAEPVPSPLGFERVDHVTANGLTMWPIVEWYRHVLGFEQIWDIQFHTDDVGGVCRTTGSGLKSIVMEDPTHTVKFATNEPLAPYFDASQITTFVYDNGGAGVQHVAFEVREILPTVEAMRARGVQFLDAPPSYYAALPARLTANRVSRIDEPMGRVQANGVLVDGADDKYMLQIFMREASGYYGDDRAGPFFYEIIQRAGDEGFGGGNFRALFESIEADQKVRAAIVAS